MMVFVHDGCRGATVSGVSMISGQTCLVILGQPCPVEIIRKRGLAVRACPTFNSTLVVGFLAAGCTFKNKMIGYSGHRRSCRRVPDEKLTTGGAQLQAHHE
ncbi:unnamed protein product [Pylaiella littoralis]